MPSNQAAIDHYADVVEDQLKEDHSRFAEPPLGKGMVAMMLLDQKELDGI